MPGSESFAAAPTRFPLTVVRSRVRFPQLSIPPPVAPAYGSGASSNVAIPLSTELLGATRFPVITASRIVTVAPSVSSAPGAMKILRPWPPRSDPRPAPPRRATIGSRHR